ncbi:MAG: hypothetical protein ACR2MT_01615 [Aurantibacter sp.]
MRFKLTALLLVFSLVTISAQHKRWTLEECVAYALENNITIQQ